MFLQRVMTRSSSVAAALMLVAASSASAQQQRVLFQWTGPVDRQVDIIMRGREISTRVLGGVSRGRENSRLESALPRDEGFVNVDVKRGRGQAEVIQQPSARNDYTTIIRVRDQNPGQQQYALTALWTSRGIVPPGRGGPGRGRGGRGGIDNRQVAHWSGSVDDDVEVRIQGHRLDTVVRSGNGTRGVRTDVQGLPNNNVGISIRQNEGRGSIAVVQQPNARNGYTAIIRVRDPQSGYGNYDFDVVWQ